LVEQWKKVFPAGKDDYKSVVKALREQKPLKQK
jgi:hypothetical protein